MALSSKMINKWKNGKVYRMVAGDLVYYGSTTKSLRQRLSEHKSKWKAGTLRATSKLLFDTGDTVDIELIEECPCTNKKELQTCERVYIENDDCVNARKPCWNGNEKVECECGCVVRENYLERHRKTERHRNCLESLSTPIDSARRERLEKKRIKIECECGCLVSRTNLARHKQSEKHKKRMNSESAE